MRLTVLKKKPSQTSFARGLRRGQTDAESALWQRLRAGRLQGVRFKRQVPIGPYVADFVSLTRGLVIEVDGGQHNDDALALADARRTEWLQARGYRVLRVWNMDVQSNLDGVLEEIDRVLSEVSPSP